MTGLLHRLAARAAGTTMAVRSDARLPFGGIEPGPGTAAAVVEPSSVFATPAAMPIAPAPLDGSRVDPRMPNAAAGTPPPQAPRADPAPSVAAHPGRDPRASFPDAAPRTVTEAVPPPMVEMVIDHGRASRSRAESAAESAHRSAAPLALDAAGRPGAALVVRDPPLLIPLAVSDRAPVPTAVAPAAIPTALGAAQNAARAEPGDVHIHIGRVEVTAVHEAPAPRRRPVPAPSPMSLDAYFARRGRG
jgi:hypothetical protein